MSDRDLDVYLDWQGETLLLGRLWTRSKGSKETSSFEYDETWLAREDRFSLDPALPLAAGQFHAAGLFNAFKDPAPDRWGRNLLLRRERRQAKAESRPPRTLLDVDYLVLVEDENRLGALRFADSGTKTFLAHSDRPIPPLVRLGTLLSAATRVIDDKESDNDLRLLLAPGASLGGARPKASVVDQNDQLLIAKFPSPTDDWPVPRWEATAMALARAAGIHVPPSELHEVHGRPVFVVRRFDRDEAKQRVPFLSAMTALGASDEDVRSYIELLDLLRQDGVAPDRDSAELWRRMVFNVLISNTDDHLRNHGYLREPGGWRLAPAYDLNPMPVDVKPRHHALTLDETDDTSSIDTVVSVAEYFGLKLPQAKQIVAEVTAAVLDWRDVAAANGLTVAQIDRMASAFEHEDILKAVA